MEHYWKLCPVWIIKGTTHTLVEVIHSSNREHRHGLESDSEQGFYSFLWPLTVPGDQDVPTDFDDLYTFYSNREYGHGLMASGKNFSNKGFMKAVEKATRLITELTKYHSASEDTREAR